MILRLIDSGAGDILSCFTALHDWRAAADHGHDDFDPILHQRVVDQVAQPK